MRTLIAISLIASTTGCSCDDPSAKAVMQSFETHPADWDWDGLFLYNDKAHLSWWKHSFDIFPKPTGSVWSASCRYAVWQASAPIRVARERETRANIEAKAAKGLPAMSKPTAAATRNPLKNGAGYPLRTDDPLITNPAASLKPNDLLVNRIPGKPQLSDTFQASVNRDRPFSLPSPIGRGGGE